ncbi:MAG: hypothetical protein CMC70_03165 [Flavobacteriaceae bacterium]|nr:hypothetical protein [Flavobacteriaceae bacterium]
MSEAPPKNPLISIIVPNYNHAAFLPERLASIYNQSYKNIEVILLDDCSTDESVAVLEQYRNHPKTAHFVINGENSGSPFLQWKKGMMLAKGDYFWIAESDDTCALNLLEQLVHSLQRYDVAVAYTETLQQGSPGKEVKHPAFKDDTIPVLDIASLLYCPILNVSSTLFKQIKSTALRKAIFTNFSLIGDRVFYYEFFQGKKLHLNVTTTNYFRKEGAGVSHLASKDLQYLARYFYEHMKFITYVQKVEGPAVDALSSLYIQRFFHRVRDRISRKEKLSLTYLKLYLYYQYKLFIG